VRTISCQRALVARHVSERAPLVLYPSFRSSFFSVIAFSRVPCRLVAPSMPLQLVHKWVSSSNRLIHIYHSQITTDKSDWRSGFLESGPIARLSCVRTRWPFPAWNEPSLRVPYFRER
jgi:hypothetical protein